MARIARSLRSAGSVSCVAFIAIGTFMFVGHDRNR
jgi:hypothetical protein